MTTTTTTFSPAKCKAFLAKIKQDILDRHDDSSSSGGGISEEHYLFCSLMALELLQRGVLLMDASSVLSSSATDNDKNKATTMSSSILNAISDAAGKTLINTESSTSSLPKPLLAGSAAMAGRVAQVAAAAAAAAVSSSEDKSILSVDTDVLQSTRERCQQVQDDRFLVLLDVIFPPNAPTTSSNGDEKSDEQKEQQQQQLRRQQLERSMSFLTIAEGYFYRAASFQPDAPPTWKRAWDVVVERKNMRMQQQEAQQSSSSSSSSASASILTLPTAAWDARPALIQLRRIATSKGNTARASELALVLTSSLLDHCPTNNGESSKDDDDKSENYLLLNRVLQAHVRPTIVSMNMNTEQQQASSLSRPRAIRQAAKILRELSANNDDDSGNDDKDFLTLCLKVQVALAMEQTVLIEERALELHQAAMNRRNTAVNNNNKKNTKASKAAAAAPVMTLQAARDKAQCEYAWKRATATAAAAAGSEADMDNVTDDYEVVTALQESAVALRDALLASEETNTNDPTKRQEHGPLACALLDRYMRSQKQLARSVALVYRQKLEQTSKRDVSINAATTAGVVDQAWRSLYEFVTPIMQSYSKRFFSSSSSSSQADSNEGSKDAVVEHSDSEMSAFWLSCTESEREMVQTAAMLVPCTCWMLAGSNDTGSSGGDENDDSNETTHRVEMLQAVYPVLSVLHQQATTQWENAKASAQSIISGDPSMSLSSHLEQQAVTLTCALVSTRCWLEFSGINNNITVVPSSATLPSSSSSNNNNILLMLSKLQIATASTMTGGGSTTTLKKGMPRQGRQQQQNHSLAQSSAEYGTFYLACLVAWAGLHQTPWKSCSTLPEVRNLVENARQTLDVAASQWGRRRHEGNQELSSMQDVLLDVAQADAESAFGGGGGFSTTLAQRLYRQILDCITSYNNNNSGDLSSSSASLSSALKLVQAHCYSGLAKLLVSTDSATAEKLARQSLDLSKSISIQDGGALFFWRGTSGGNNSGNDKNNDSYSMLQLAVNFQIATARQWTAHAILLQKGRSLEAMEFLEAAVREAPLDAAAAFSLGALQLRQVLFPSSESATDSTSTTPASASKLKAAQVQLLKAAKLDSSEANPFALLGYWYENNGDMKRAVGCYSKALVLDPIHPVAGRGVLRLTSPASTGNVKTAALEKALAAASGGGSPLNGWAWQATGIERSRQGQDDLAVVALLRATRARDIASPQSEPLSIYYSTPPSQGAASQCGKFPSHATTDLVLVLTELAACYRRLGRYTAAIRTYHSAIDNAGEAVTSDLLCACGNVELELGLFDESAERFALAMEKSAISSTAISSVAAYGHGQALLAMAQRDLHDGKAGASLDHILLATEGCDRSKSTSCCMSKLRGDLHSFSAALPTDLFGKERGLHDGGDGDMEDKLKCHIDFVSQGETAYMQAKEAVVAADEEEKNLICGSLLCDCASNIRAQLTLLAQYHGMGADTSTTLAPSAITPVAETLARASSMFQKAIQLSPLYAPAFCGLGCALSARYDDSGAMMLAQHAFCRALQLDPLFPDAYANLAFMYTSKNAFAVSEGVSDALTQVADTPMMWINRALILERRALENRPIQHNDKQKTSEFTQQALDAYRAAVQVVKPPCVVLGLASTGRIAEDVADWDSKAYCFEYKAVSTGGVLDKDLINILLSPGGKRSNNEAENSHASDAADAAESPVATADDATHEPHRGDLWLRLARELVLSPQEDNDDHSGDATTPKDQAARRAASLFMMQLTDPPSSRDDRAALEVQATDLSEALTLAHWLDSSFLEQEAVIDDKDKAQQPPPRPTSLDLQRALLMNPQNRLAREAIRQSQ